MEERRRNVVFRASPFSTQVIGRGGIRTHTPLSRQGILSPQCLPFHHAAWRRFQTHYRGKLPPHNSIASRLPTCRNPSARLPWEHASSTQKGAAPMRSEDLVTVYTLADSVKAQIIKNAFEAEGISCFLEGGN